MDRYYFLNNFFSIIKTFLDLFIVYYIIYKTLLIIKGTRAAQMLLGIVFIVFLFIISKEDFLNLATVNWILDKFIGSFIIILVIIFQDDIRKALSTVWKRPVFKGKGPKYQIKTLEEIVNAVSELSRIKHGALIVLEREADLSDYISQGIPINSEVSAELLITIFIPHFKNTLHDGAVIIRDGKIAAAKCILPFATHERFDKHLGTRHRAARGLAEKTDAFVIVVSEETGTVSVAFRDEWIRGLDSNSLRLRLQKVFADEEEDEKRKGK